MSHDTLNDPGTGYYLPEDSQLRLKQLHSYIDFLSRLARPRTYDEASEVSPEVGMDELATCLALLADQAKLVLHDLTWALTFRRWPARRMRPRTTTRTRTRATRRTSPLPAWRTPRPMHRLWQSPSLGSKARSPPWMRQATGSIRVATGWCSA